MTVPDAGAIAAAVARYVGELPNYTRVAEVVSDELRDLLDRASIHAKVSGRSKDVRSFHKKIVAKGYTDPWNDVTDKAGVRAILDRANDVDRAVALMRGALGDRIIRVEDKRQILQPHTFGYSGVHVQVAVSADGKDYECEVQIRTGAQDLWSVMSHDLLYKPIVSLPVDMQHAAYRLVALVELFDEEIQRLVERGSDGSGEPAMRIVLAAEDQFLALAHSPSNRELSLQIIGAIMASFGPEELAGYETLLAAFVDAERDALESLFREYGPHSPVAYLAQYLLLGQAEAVVLLERLSAKPHLLVRTWVAAGLPMVYLETLAEAAAIPLPDV